MSRLIQIIFSSSLVLSTCAACGVKAPPTPLLDSPPSLLEQEAAARAAEKKESKKDSEKMRP